MNRLILSLFGVLLAIILPSCQQGPAEPQQGPSPASSVVQGKGAKVLETGQIAWFEGSVDEAFALAREQGKPLFVYWGAKWCPPCNQLKSTVFNRPDFIRQTRQFIALKIDGDDPSAQRWAEHFGALGYPTLIVFDATGTELTRLSSGNDLQRYAQVLGYAASGGEAMQRLVSRAASEGSAKLSAEEWAQLAWYPWAVDLGRLLPEEGRAEQFLSWSSATDVQNQDLRQRFALLHWLERLERASAPPPSAAEREDGLRMLDAILAGPSSWLPSLTDLQYQGVDLIALLTPDDEAQRARLLGKLLAVMELVHGDQSLPTKQRVLATRALIDAEKLRDPAFPAADLVERVQRRAQLASQEAKTPYERQSLIYNLAWYLHEVGESAQAIQMLETELERAVAPYYYMLYLARIEAARGRADAALGWSRRAWREAQGPATRFQWGVSHTQRLLELAPDSSQEIEGLLGELAGLMARHPGSFYQRSRVRLGRLAPALTAWAADDSGRAAILQSFRQDLRQACEQLETGSEARRSCASFAQMG